MSLDLHPFLQPAVVWGLAVALLLAVLWGTKLLADRNVPPFWLRTLTVLRLAAVVAIVLMLLRPVVRVTRVEPATPERLVLIDTSGSMGRSDTAGGATRLEDVLRRLDEPRLRSRWMTGGDKLHWYAFDTHARPVEEGGLRRLRADGDDTDLATALEEALQLHRWGLADPSAERLPPRVLLLSDGNHRGRGDPQTAAARLGVAVDFLAPVCVAPASVPYMEITGVQHSPRLLLGSDLRMQVTVRQQGSAGLPAEIVLSDGDQAVVSQPLKFTQEREEQQFMLQFRPERAGLQRYDLRLEGGSPGAAAAAGSVTGRVVTVRVESEFHDILMIEPEWRWSFRHLRRVIEGDPGFAYSAFLSRGPGVFVQFGDPRRRVNLTGFPRSQAELEGFDTIILGDVRPGSLPPALIPALIDLVTERGKSLVVIAGPDIGSWLSHPELAALLPVEVVPGGGLTAGPVPVRISDEARPTPFFFAPDGQTSLQRWRQLPDMDQIYAPQRKKPAATVLLESPAMRNSFGPLIVAAVHTVGRGQVLFVATDTLWKWQMMGQIDANGNTPYSVFWQQALRAVRPSRLGGQGIDLWLYPERTMAREGEEIVLHARVEGGSPQQRLTARYRGGDGREMPLAFHPLPASPREYRASFVAREAGLYHVSAEVQADGETRGSAETRIEVAGRPPEGGDAPPDEALLARLAAASGGRNLALPPDPAAADRDSGAAPPLERRESVVDLWSNLSLAVILTLILGADWLLRLMRGYI